MNLIQRLEQSDTVFLSKLAFEVSAAVGLGGALYKADPSPKERYDLCPIKAAGVLELLLPVQALQLPVAVPPLTLRFVGKWDPTSGEQMPVVNWSIRQDINLPVSIFGFDAVLESASGGFSTSVIDLSPTAGAACDGTERVYWLILEPSGTAGALEVTGAVDVAGVDQPLSAKLTDLRVQGLAGETAKLDVSIKILQNGCGTRHVAGSTVTLYGAVSGIPFGSQPVFKWTIAGGVLNGPDNQSSCSVTLPAATNSVQVTLAVTAGPLASVANRTVWPLEEHTAKLMNLLCRLKGELVRNFPVDPLWDPLRDRPVSPLRAAQWREVMRSAERLSAVAEEMQALARKSVG